MALISPTSGPYTSVYQPPGIVTAINLGIMRWGYVLEWTLHGHDINRTTSWGRTTIEGIYLGADWRLTALALEYAAPASAGGSTVVLLPAEEDQIAFPPEDGTLTVIDASTFLNDGTALVVKADGATAAFSYTGKEANKVLDITVSWDLTGVALLPGAVGGQVNDGAAVIALNAFGGGVPDAAWPWNFADVRQATLPTPVGPTFAVQAGAVSRRYTDAAGTLMLTAVSGTPAEGSPATLTAQKAISNRRGRLNFDSKLREVPLDFQLLPVTDESGDPGVTTEIADHGWNHDGNTFPFVAGTLGLPVASTAGFTNSGTLTVTSPDGTLMTTVGYSGFSANRSLFVNVLGGSGTFPVGSLVTQQPAAATRWWTST